MLLAALALGGCDRAPAPNAAAPARVTPVDAPAEIEGAPDYYTNTKFGFTIAVPRNWIESPAAASEDGAIFNNKALDADLRLFAAPNENDANFQAAVEAMRDGTTGATGAMVGDHEYRGAATDSEGYRINLRLLRKQDNRLVSAIIRYPVARHSQLDALAAATLDSLKLTGE